MILFDHGIHQRIMGLGIKKLTFLKTILISLSSYLDGGHGLHYLIYIITGNRFNVYKFHQVGQ